jgi:REP element-mobilizing transposase RayT
MADKQKYNPVSHHRRSIRLQHYDYAGAGAYFITICTHNRKCMFGQVGAGSKPAQFHDTQFTNPMFLNKYGEIVIDTWEDLVNHITGIELDAFVIMPNHVHGIVVIGEAAPCSLSEIVRQLKTFSARRINKMRGTQGILVWQRNYYEHIIRGEDDLNSLREYIDNNPVNWQLDENYPETPCNQ